MLGALLKRLDVWLLVAAMSGAATAGCLGDPGTAPPPQAEGGIGLPTTFTVQDASTHQPVFLARVTVLGDEGPIVVVTTNTTGVAPVIVPSTARSYEVAAVGFGLSSGTLTNRPSAVLVRLQPIQNATDIFAGSGLTFRRAVDLGSYAYPAAVGTSCQDVAQDRDGDCGLGEPSVEVDALGQIYVTGVCCIGSAPPLYVSRDDGATFQELRTPNGVREAFGVEADLAIDADGVLYMADIEVAGSFQLTAWDSDGTFLRHMKWPAPPLVDRDWVRADGSGNLYYVYNTGSGTNVYTSTDGGQTWSPAPVFAAPYGLGNAVKGNAEGELWLLSPGGERRRADSTLDGGTTWRTETTTSPSGPNGFATGSFDEAGSMYVIGYRQDQVFVTRRSPEGVWGEPQQVTPNFGHHQDAWIAGGGPGKVAVSWYGTLDENRDSNWFLFAAVSLNADQPNPTWQIAIADPEPVSVGEIGRRLLDFQQIEIGPDGSVHIAYAKLRPTADNGEERLQYVHSEPTLPLARVMYLVGPA